MSSGCPRKTEKTKDFSGQISKFNQVTARIDLWSLERVKNYPATKSKIAMYLRQTKDREFIVTNPLSLAESNIEVMAKCCLFYNEDRHIP